MATDDQIRLSGVTWDHPRGYGPLRASSEFWLRQTGVRVEWEARSLKEFGDAPVEELARRFDLVIIDHPHAGQAARANCFLPLQDWLPEADFGVHAGPSLNSYRYDGRQLALPVDAACQAAVYRPDLIEGLRRPTDWKDLFSFAGDLRERNLWMGMALCPTDSLCTFLTLSAQLGVAPEADDPRRWIDPDGWINVLRRMRRLAGACHPRSQEMNPIQLLDSMSGEMESGIAYAPFVFGYTNYSREGMRPRQLAYAGIPGGRGSLLGGAGIAVSASCKNPREAVAYMRWVVGGLYQKGDYIKYGGQPSHLEAWQDPVADACCGRFFSAIRSTIDHAFVRPRHPDWPVFQECLGRRVHAFLASEEEPERVVADLRRHLG